jgi:hypothetical protein
VKRADEQAFARLNWQNIMYVEGAARRLQEALRKSFETSSVSVRHLEMPVSARCCCAGFKPITFCECLRGTQSNIEESNRTTNDVVFVSA